MDTNPALSRRRPNPPPSAEELFAGLSGPNPRRALARAITLLESQQPADVPRADALLDLLEAYEPPHPTFRLGISGTPGVGKSTFVETFGLRLAAAGHRLAILAVDPTSSLSGGSILGDKTRMEELSRHPNVFIRPSPTAGHHGGVGAASRATLLCCEAAGYDYVIVETVGVGQAEHDVHRLSDAFLLLAQPAAGDDLQGIKRGILELADVVAVNKKDRLPEANRQTVRELKQGLHLAPARPDGWVVPVLAIAGLTGEGLEELQQVLERYATTSRRTGSLAQRRADQRHHWLRERCEQTVLADLRAFLTGQRRTTDEIQRIIDEQVSLTGAAAVIVNKFYTHKSPSGPVQ